MGKGTKQEKLIIDGYGLREKIFEQRKKNQTCPYSAHLLYLNDCRQDITIDHPTTEDQKYWNCDFVEAELNGFPLVFVVTRCDVKRGSEFLTYYGVNYDLALKQLDECERMRNCVISLVDNSILKGVDLSNDTWTIE